MTSFLDAARSAIGEGISTTLAKSGAYLSVYGPLANSLTATIYWNVAKFYWRRRHQTQLRAMGVPIDPFQYRWVDPADIVALSPRNTPNHIADIGRVMSGPWDQRPSNSASGDIPWRFEETRIYRSLKRRFRDGVEWEETEVYRHAMEQIDTGHRAWGSDSKIALKQRCRTIDNLYSTIQEEGYQTKRSLLGIHPDRLIVRLDRSRRRYGADADHVTRTGHNPVRSYRAIIANEVLVDIDRAGEILFIDGYHRLSIAKLLDLDQIPVTVLVRHREWVDTLASLWQDRINELDHPDVPSVEYAS